MKADAIKDESDRLSPQLVVLLGTRGNVRAFARGQLLIEEGDASDALYILVTGQLKVFTRDDKGRELVYNVLEPGEFFGEFAGLDAVAGGVRLSGFGGRTMRFGPVFAGSVGSFLGGHTFLLLKWKKALVFGESLFPEFVAHLARFI